MRHNKNNCKKTFFVKPSHFINDNTRCPYCSKKSNVPIGISRNKVTDYSKDIINTIIYKYTINNLSIRKIQDDMNIDRRTISKILRENNVLINSNIEKHKKISDDVYIKIFKEKNKYNTYKSLSEKYNVPYDSIRKRKYLLKQIEYDKKKKYNLNVNYFRKIETQDQAYILGFLTADGCIAKTNNEKPNRLFINISSKDIVILKYIKEQLNSNVPIITYIPKNTYSNNEMCKISINSIAMCEYLEKYGIVPNKTGKEIFPISKLKKTLMRHFIRGFFDGDGISYNTGYIGFCSNEKFLLDLKKFLIEELNLTGTLNISKDTNDKKIYYLNIFTKSDVKKIKDYIYKNANFYLDRKFKNF